MIETPLEKIWERFGNKYKFLVRASKETRQLIEAVADGRIEATENPYILGLVRALRGEPEEQKE